MFCRLFDQGNQYQAHEVLTDMSSLDDEGYLLHQEESRHGHAGEGDDYCDDAFRQRELGSLSVLVPILALLFIAMENVIKNGGVASEIEPKVPKSY